MAEHERIVVGQAEGQLLQLHLGQPLQVRPLLVAAHIQQALGGRSSLAPAPYLQVNGDRVKDGESRLGLFSKQA